MLKPIEDQISDIEEAIKTIEERLAALNSEMLDASQNQDGATIAELSQSIHRCQQDIDRKFNRLESLTLSLEKQTARFKEEHPLS